MAYFQTKNPYLGKFWRALQYKRLLYFMAIWSVLRLFGIFYGCSINFFLFWYVASRKSGNPVFQRDEESMYLPL
jgi:hypothetical protein